MKKTVLITGASRGIGKACAVIFAMNGYNVAINYHRSEDDALKLKDDINKNRACAEAYKADVADEAQVRSMVESVVRDFGKIDVLINNAGISLHKLFTDVTPEQWRNIRSVNLDGTVYCCSAVLPYMVRQRSGRIINISSVWGVRGASCEVHYSAAKAGVIGLTKALSKEYAPCGITVNCIAPGVIKTDMLNIFDESELAELTKRIPTGRLGSTSDVARTALFLSSPDAEFITGQIIGVDGGF